MGVILICCTFGLIRLLYYLPMERMNYINKDKNYMTDAERIRYLEESIRELRKEKENLKKEKGELKSRLEGENKKLREENEMLRCNKGWTPEKVWHEEFIQYLMGENKKQKEENELLKQCLDKLMFDADVVNVKIHWELWDYVYVRSDKQFKLNVKD